VAISEVMTHIPRELKSVEDYLKSAQFHSQFRYVDIEIGKAMLSYLRGVETRAYSTEAAESLRGQISTEGIGLLETGYLNHLQSAIDRNHYDLALLLFTIAFDARDRKSELDNPFMIPEGGSRERISAVYQDVLSKMFLKINEEGNRGKIKGDYRNRLNQMYTRFCERSPAVYDETPASGIPVLPQQLLEAIL